MPDPNPVTVVNYFFTEQSVYAVKTFDPNDDSTELKSSTDVVIGEIQGTEEKRFYCEVTVSSDEESVNPSYNYHLKAYGVFKVDKEDFVIKDHIGPGGVCHNTAVVMLLGAIRERLVDLTARGPWGAVTLQAVPIPSGNTESD